MARQPLPRRYLGGPTSTTSERLGAARVIRSLYSPCQTKTTLSDQDELAIGWGFRDRLRFAGSDSRNRRCTQRS
jgi:hypothetical protein